MQRSNQIWAIKLRAAKQAAGTVQVYPKPKAVCKAVCGIAQHAAACFHAETLQGEAETLCHDVMLCCAFALPLLC